MSKEATPSKGQLHRERLFHSMATRCAEIVDGDDFIRCPLCWNLYSLEDASTGKLSIEHAPSRAVAKVAGCETVTLLTCENCNSSHGTGSDRRLVDYLRDNTVGEDGYFGALYAEVRSEVDGEIGPPIRGEFKFNPDEPAMQTVPVKKQNNPTDLDENRRLQDKPDATDRKWHIRFRIHQNYPEIRRAYLRTAYLYLVSRSTGVFAYSDAGRFVRSLIASDDPPPKSLISISNALPTKVNWWGWIEAPDEMSCIVVKVANQMVIFPRSDEDSGECYERWANVAQDSTDMGFVPPNTHVEMQFVSEIDSIRGRADWAPVAVETEDDSICR